MQSKCALHSIVVVSISNVFISIISGSSTRSSLFLTIPHSIGIHFLKLEQVNHPMQLLMSICTKRQLYVQFNCIVQYLDLQPMQDTRSFAERCPFTIDERRACFRSSGQFLIIFRHSETTEVITILIGS